MGHSRDVEVILYDDDDELGNSDCGPASRSLSVAIPHNPFPHQPHTSHLPIPQPLNLLHTSFSHNSHTLQPYNLSQKIPPGSQRSNLIILLLKKPFTSSPLCLKTHITSLSHILLTSQPPPYNPTAIKTLCLTFIFIHNPSHTIPTSQSLELTNLKPPYFITLYLKTLLLPKSLNLKTPKPQTTLLF